MFFEKFKRNAFTLAEMLLVLLILSIIMAATLPVFTKRTNVPTSLWQYSSNNSDIYFGDNTGQGVLIGSNKFESGESSKLLINKPNDDSFVDIIFKKNGTKTGELVVDNKNNVGLGSVTLQENSTALGSNAASSGQNAVAIGYSSTASGSGSIAIGNNTNASATNSVAIGAGTTSGTNNYITLGTNAYTVDVPGTIRTGALYVNGVQITMNSDSRLKNISGNFTDGLNKIKLIKPYNYTLKSDKEKTHHVGVIAQELQRIFPNAVKKGSDGYLTVRQEDMFYAMLNAIKELEKKNNELEARLLKLEQKN